MAEKKPLSDNQVHDRVAAALEALGHESAETVRGNTALEAARRALRMIGLGLLHAGEAAEQINDPKREPSER